MKLAKPLNQYFDHTLLKPEATSQQIEKLCKEALQYDFYSVCVNSCHVASCADLLRGSEIRITAVVGFPLGACNTATKVFETEEACKDGASEIDMVLNIGFFKDGKYDAVRDDISEVVQAASQYGSTVKVILETCLLSPEEIKEACLLAKESGAAYVKTSTGFNSGCAVAEDVALMGQTVGPHIGVKASGGIRDLSGVMAMIQAGADRIGASASVSIMEEYRSQSKE